MTTFDRREEAFEGMFAHDEEMHFKAEAHRTKLLGAWVAGLLGKDGVERDGYVADLIAYSVRNGGEQALYERVRADLPNSVPDAEIRTRMATLMTEAVAFMKTA